MMRIAVFGAGGVGGYFGGLLAKAGMEVIFIARGAHLQAIQQAGLLVESPRGSFTIYPARVEQDPANIEAVDFVLVAVKAWQVPEAAQAIRPMMGFDTIAIPLENGVEAAGQLSQVLGSDHVASGLCRISSQIAGPGRIQHVGMEPYIAFNWSDAHQDLRLEALRDAFLSQGIRAEIPADIQSAVWEKFVFVAALSGLGAVTRAPVGVQRSVPETRQLLESAVSEVAAVGRACGVVLGESIEQATLRLIDSLPPGTTTSMQRDIISGKPSELEFQTGSVVRLGCANGVDTPVNSCIYASLLPQEKRARGSITF